MKTIKTLLVVGLTILTGAAAHAEEVVLAWQTPGYVMEEIVVTAKRPAKVPQEPAEAIRELEVADQC